jgi:hypothetical protein
MEISIFGYKVNVQILILIGVVYLIMAGHTLCGCSNYGLLESFGDMSGNKLLDFSGNSVPIPAGNVTDKIKGAVQSKEGFTGTHASESPYDLVSSPPVNTASWGLPNLTITPGQPVSSGVQDFLARKQQTLPLPEGEMSFFANMEFKPECCPNSYSNSVGCACMGAKDVNYLLTRGGNNVPYSEF